MSRRVLFLIALVFVADSIAVNGRSPRPIKLSGQVELEVAHVTRLQPFALR
jgi:hypothetical protein